MSSDTEGCAEDWTTASGFITWPFITCQAVTHVHHTNRISVASIYVLYTLKLSLTGFSQICSILWLCIDLLGPCLYTILIWPLTSRIWQKHPSGPEHDFFYFWHMNTGVINIEEVQVYKTFNPWRRQFLFLELALHVEHYPSCWLVSHYMSLPSLQLFTNEAAFEAFSLCAWAFLA